MPTLSITAPDLLGPLTLQLLTARGRALPSPPMLTSTRRHVTVEAAVGDYVVIATRTTGQTITADASVKPAGGEARLGEAVASPNEFMSDAAARGFVPGIDRTRPQVPPTISLQNRIGVSGDAGRVISALIAAPRTKSSFNDRYEFQLDTFDPDRLRLPTSLQRSWVTNVDVGYPSKSLVARTLDEDGGARVTPLWICTWTWSEGRWQRDLHTKALVTEDVGPGYLRISFQGGEYPRRKPTRAIGLVDPKGYGPIVVVPPFAQGVDVVFLADGLTAARGANRITNPSALRVPVALAIPRDPQLADMLSALDASGVPGATQLLSADDAASVDNAFEALWRKGEDYAAAALGAHYLLRFMPKRIPLEWLENLMRLRPEVADGPALLASRMIAVGGKQGAPVAPKVIRDLIREGLSRPVTLFARSRGLLAQGARLYGPRQRARKLVTVRPRRLRSSDFLDVAAGAGGLEAIWGAAPDKLDAFRPPSGSIRPTAWLENGLFARVAP